MESSNKMIFTVVRDKSTLLKNPTPDRDLII
jgi:hypothetical protein